MSKTKGQQLKDKISSVRKEFKYGIACRDENIDLSGLFVNTDPKEEKFCRESEFQARKIELAIQDMGESEVLKKITSTNPKFTSGNDLVSYVRNLRGTDASVFTRKSGLQRDVHSKDWHSGKKLEVMYDIQKDFIKNQEGRGRDYAVSALVMANLGLGIIESSATDEGWGIKTQDGVRGAGTGENNLGSIHSIIGKELQKEYENAIKNNQKFFNYAGINITTDEVEKKTEKIKDDLLKFSLVPLMEMNTTSFPGFSNKPTEGIQVNIESTSRKTVLTKLFNQKEPKLDLAEDTIIIPGSSGTGKKVNKEIGETDLITTAIREQILEKQLALFQEEIAKTEENIKNLNKENFKKYITTEEGKQLYHAVSESKEFQKKLGELEIKGYAAIHQQFADSFKNVEWTKGNDEVSRATKLTNKDGKDLGTLVETTIPQKPPLSITLSDGSTQTIDSYRKIDFPKQLEGQGPMHMSMAVKDAKGNNIAADKAIYFTAHYDKNGKLNEVSSPQPIKFMGEGKDAIAYIERDGQIYTLPVDRAKYEEMMKEVAKNKGIGVDVSKVESIESQDLVKTGDVGKRTEQEKDPKQEFQTKYSKEEFEKKTTQEEKIKFIQDIARNEVLTPDQTKKMLTGIESKDVNINQELQNAIKKVDDKMIENMRKKLTPYTDKQATLSQTEISNTFAKNNSVQIFSNAPVDQKSEMIKRVTQVPEALMTKNDKEKLLKSYQSEVTKMDKGDDKDRLTKNLTNATQRVKAQDQGQRR